MRICVVLNTGAGGVDGDQLAAERASLAAAFAAQQVDAQIVCSAAGDLRRNAEQAREQAGQRQIDAVVVAGGDGSISTFAAVLAGTGIPLGILPLGTLNHFAKDLGLPARIEDAVAVIASGRTRAVDVAEVNGRVFINNSSIGIYPYMVLERERRRRGDGLGKWLAMCLAFLRVIRHFPQRRLSISAEGWTEPCRTPCVVVGNNAYGIDLFTLGKRQRLDAGKLWLAIARLQTRFAFLRLALGAALGGLDQTRDFQTLEAGALEIRSRASRLPVSLDGEVETMRSPLRYRTRPRALTVLAPAGA